SRGGSIGFRLGACGRTGVLGISIVSFSSLSSGECSPLELCEKSRNYIITSQPICKYPLQKKFAILVSYVTSTSNCAGFHNLSHYVPSANRSCRRRTARGASFSATRQEMDISESAT